MQINLKQASSLCKLFFVLCCNERKPVDACKMEKHTFLRKVGVPWRPRGSAHQPGNQNIPALSPAREHRCTTFLSLIQFIYCDLSTVKLINESIKCQKKSKKLTILWSILNLKACKDWHGPLRKAKCEASPRISFRPFCFILKSLCRWVAIISTVWF